MFADDRQEIYSADSLGRVSNRKSVYRSYAWAILIFLFSRLVIALGLLFSAKYLPVAPDVWSAGPSWYHQLLQWDSEWYFRIATGGYRYNGDPTVSQNVVFYPLYPLLCRAIATMSGIGIPDSMLIVSNIAGLCAIVVLFKFVREEFGDEIGHATVALLSFFPTSVMLSAGYTEPLALLLIVSFFLALKRKQFLWAALFAALASATRATGAVLLPVLMWEIWANCEPRPPLRAAISYGLLATSGLCLFMAYLWYAFGDPLVLLTAQSGYHLGTTMGARFISALELEPFSRMILNDWNPWGWDSWFTLLFLIAIVACYFRLRTSLTLFALGVLLLPYLTLSGGPAGFVSMARFNLLSFPIFIILADFALRAKPALVGMIGLSGAALFMDTVLFARRIWIG
jgi:Gpi18-like mannosyltransferase